MFFINLEPLNLCTKSLCLNGGTCEMLADSTDYRCLCKNGYYGKNCENTCKLFDFFKF